MATLLLHYQHIGKGFPPSCSRRRVYHIALIAHRRLSAAANPFRTTPIRRFRKRVALEYQQDFCDNHSEYSL
jgi:hypothetical protein